MLKSINPRLIRAVALYAPSESLIAVSKAIKATEAAIASPPDESLPFEKHPEDVTSVDVRQEGIIDWIKSIPVAASVPQSSPSHGVAAENVAIFRQVAATFRARGLLA